VSQKLILKLRQERDAARASAETILGKEESGTTLADSEKKNLESLVTEASALDERIAELTKMETARLEAVALDAKFDGLRSERLQITERAEAPKTIGTQFTESDAFQSYLSTPTGKSGLVTLSASSFAPGDPAVTNDLVPVSRVRDAAQPNMVTPLLDSCGYEPVSGNSVDWIEWPADPVPSAPVSEGGVKPQAEYQPVLQQGTLEKWAHSVPFTREMMEDVPRFTSMLNGSLLRGLRRKAEANAGAVLAGGTYASATGSTLLESIRIGIAQAELNGYPANSVAINPLDYAQIDIDLLASTLLGARKDSPVWGVRVIPAAAVAAGEAYVGDFQAGLLHLDRQVTALYLTDSHGEEFLSNILRALAESRNKVVVQQANAIVKCTATP
jgi:HK97 family phage major capsid protein